MAQTCWKCGAPPMSASESQLDRNETIAARASLDFAHLLASNDLPLDSQIPIIPRYHLRWPKPTALAQLVRNRDEASEKIRQHRSILSPVRRALSYPSLWSCIAIPSGYGNGRHIMSILEAQLLRSANAPLEIHWLDVHYHFDPQLLDLIFPHCHRWRSLYFHNSTPDSCLLDWLQPVNGLLHILGRGARFPDVFSSAPNLRRVILTDWNFSIMSPLPTSLVIPWGQITHYRGAHTPELQLEIFKGAPNLVECAIGFDKYRPVVVPGSNPAVVLPNLRRLRIEVTNFLIHLTAPALEELSVSSYAYRDILPFIQRSSCTLTRLFLDNTMMAYEAIPLLRDLLALTYLHIENGAYDEENRVTFFTAMTISGAPSDLCPNLASIVYGCRNWDGDSAQESFLAMARSRFQPHSSHPGCLARLRCFRFRPDKVWADIKMLQDEGFDVGFLGHLTPRELQLLRDGRVF
ncbi:hypothetical protein B0H13DRAFT_2096852 [Mycena leptocephala]|nr:hypothetical protein B0H13DRAFT_2096852 [Mycena leptocephala]